MSDIYYYFMGIFISGIGITHIFTVSKCNNTTDQKMAECRKKYENEIYQLKKSLKELSARYESLQSNHAILSNHNKNYETQLRSLHEKKSTLEYQSAQFQRELYAARKRIKKLLGYKQK